MPASWVDDDQARLLVADRLSVVGQGAVEQDVVAGFGLHHRLSLRDPNAAREDDVVLVAGMGVEAGPVARRHRALEDRDVACDPAVDLRHRARADVRLGEESVAWLMHRRERRTPTPTPVWFWWDGETFLVYSQRDKPKLRHIVANPRVAIALALDEVGGLRAVVTGDAAVDGSTPAAFEQPGYIGKYRNEIARLGSNPEEFSAAYSVPIRIRPTRLRAW